MAVVIHPHAHERMLERGASFDEIAATVLCGEMSEAKQGRSRFRRNFSGEFMHNGRRYGAKQLEIIAVQEDNDWVVITVIVKWF